MRCGSQKRGGACTLLVNVRLRNVALTAMMVTLGAIKITDSIYTLVLIREGIHNASESLVN
jgi:hypothetical protein